MYKVVLFAGTTEGRELAEFLKRHEVETTVCVATEYGGQLVNGGGSLTVHAGRLDVDGICALIRENQDGKVNGSDECREVSHLENDQTETGVQTSSALKDAADAKYSVIVVDATHPYAQVVSENIKSACEKADAEYVRLLRAESAFSKEAFAGDEKENAASEKVGTQASVNEKAGANARQLKIVADVQEAVDFLAGTKGNILVTTGSKELAKFTAIPDYQERVYARVLSTPDVAKSCSELGFVGRHLICMQGPFGEALNTALLKEFDAAWLVTKESGKTGGFEEKVRAASAAGANLVLIGRPTKEQGMTPQEVRTYLSEKLGFHKKRKIAIVGIGMGDGQNMTIEARNACEKAQLLVGAQRMVAGFAGHKETFVSYRPQEIKDYLDAHPEYEEVALLQSGDVGFYSGAKKLFEVFAGEELSVYPGISSVVYLCDQLHLPWEDVKLLSLHGRNANLIAEVRTHKKVFAIVADGEAVQELCKKLISYGMGQTIVHVGEELSYPEERIVSGTAEELAEQSFAKLCAVLIENKNAEAPRTHGIADEEFLRDKVPMTKSEIRSISLSKLGLREDSVMYDVGAGTGSVSIEAAIFARRGQVYAIERKAEAVALIKENQKKFAADNLIVVEGLAPEALKELPAPTHVFIGGSAGNLREIMETVLHKNPKVRIVINCIALETVAESLECLKALPVEDVDIAAVSVAKAKSVAAYHMMMGTNPVYVISCTGAADTV